jgi:effector-binding domain-containing protein
MLIEQNNRCRKTEKKCIPTLAKSDSFCYLTTSSLTDTDMQYNSALRLLIPAAAAILCFACNGSAEKTNTAEAPKTTADTAKAPEKSAGDSADAPAKRAPAINIFDTLAVKKIVLCMKDSAAAMDRIGMKLGAIYGGKLAKCIKDNKLTVTGAPMAWYKTQKAPYFFEAGMPVDKAPAKLPPGVFVKELPAGNVMIARYFGPYEMMGMAYEAAADRMKSGNIRADGPPYEVYIGDPMIQKDPYKVQTDVVFPVKAQEKN